jgi:hypothetical protein
MNHLSQWMNCALTSISLLLFVATAGVWLDSYRATDCWNYSAPPDALHYRNQQTIRAVRGSFWYAWQHNGGFATAIRDAHQRYFEGFHSYPSGWMDLYTGSMKGPRFAGFEFVYQGTIQRKIVARVVVVPMWSVLAITALLPSAWFWRAIRRWKERPPGVCHSCGYDLRASPGRCPECGIEPVAVRIN